MRNSDPLLFIDTNIFLDFYRATGSQDFKLLDRLKEVDESIITSHQVEMEFQKNRQGRMSEAFEKLRFTGPTEIPGMFVGTSELDELNAAVEQLENKLKILRDRLTGAVVIPAVGDFVYKTARKIFSFESAFNLTRSKPEYSRILRQARRRFMLGYPPKKEKDTSMGDAVNWEWIVECATTSKRNVIIVSRDSDYGLRFDKVRHLNEWLLQEFSERVGSSRSVELTDSLSTALKKANIRVTKAEQKAEEELILGAQEPSFTEEEWTKIFEKAVTISGHSAFPSFTSAESITSEPGPSYLQQTKGKKLEPSYLPQPKAKKGKKQ